MDSPCATHPVTVVKDLFFLGASAVKTYSTRSCAYPAAPSAEMISAM